MLICFCLLPDDGTIKDLGCEKAGINTGEREAIIVNEKFQTNVPHIYAVGDVIGFPALASTGMDQGRVAVAHIFKSGELHTLTEIFPYGIYTVPEVSMVGLTEENAKSGGLIYVWDIAIITSTARGQIMADKDNGFLKMVVEKDTKIIRGVHIMGNIATELIHYGITLVKDRKTLDEVIDSIQLSLLHDLYKYASYDALGNLFGKKLKKSGAQVRLNQM